MTIIHWNKEETDIFIDLKNEFTDVFIESAEKEDDKIKIMFTTNDLSQSFELIVDKEEEGEIIAENLI